MENLIQPKGSVSKETTKQSIALYTDALISEIEYVSNGLFVETLKYLYEPKSQTIWKTIPTALGTINSWSINGNIMKIVTSSGTYDFPRFYLKHETYATPEMFNVPNKWH